MFFLRILHVSTLTPVFGVNVDTPNFRTPFDLKSVGAIGDKE